MKNKNLYMLTLCFIFFAFYLYADVNLVQTFEKENMLTNQHYGRKIKQCNDLNGDGFDDICMLEELKIESLDTDQYIYRLNVYFGGTTIDTEADVIIENRTLHPSFSFECAGDIDGDGYSDILIPTNEIIYIYKGDRNFDNTIDYKIANGIGRIYSIRNIGDFNSDGYSDYRIGTWYNGDYILRGSTNPSETISIPYNSYTISNCEGVGDINNDGYSDLVFRHGEYPVAYISYYPGNTKFNFSAVEMMQIIGCKHVSSISFLGDVNGNGVNDYIIELSGSNCLNDYSYEITIYDGATNRAIKEKIINERSPTTFKYESAGDINNDGFDDTIMSKYYHGEVYILLGSENFDFQVDYIIQDEIENTLFGYPASSAGDMNNDGFDDLLISNQMRDKKCVYFYEGANSFNSVPSDEFQPKPIQNYFAYSGSGLGDTNLDGVDDFIIGAFGYNNNMGRAFMFYGANPINDIPAQIFRGYDEGYFHGIAVSGAGDVNKDGYQDIIIGAEGAPNGQAKIYFGGDLVDATSDVRLQGKQAGSFFGQAVTNISDVNQDGYDDVLVGAYKESNETGKAYLYFGGETMDNIEDMTFTGSVPTGRFGFTIDKAGDVNGDGASDFIIGEPGTGMAYLYYGGPALDNSPDLLFSDNGTTNNFGSVVAGLGDLNGDGYADIGIGACFHNLAIGRAYVCFGGANPDAIADLTFDGEPDDLNFGVAIASAGDVNADGYSDLLIGSRGTNNFTGRTYLYFGSDQMDNEADDIFNGEIENSFFGSMVTGVGDILQNGFDEILIGAFWNGGGQNGKAYLYGYEPDEVIMEYTFASPGWYLVSLPLELETANAASLFPGIIGDQVFIWDAASQEYVGITEIVPGGGFWLPVEQPFTTSITGIPIYRNDYHFSNAGWHLIGSIYRDITITNPQAIPNGSVLSTVFSYNEQTGAYYASNQITHQQAHWVAVNEAGHLIVKPSSNPVILSKSASQNEIDSFIHQFGNPPVPPNRLSDVALQLPQPLSFDLYPNYPNPFNPTTHIKYSCAEAGNVNISIYSATGQKIRTLYHGMQQAGFYELQWNGTNDNGNQVPSGVYLIKFATPGQIKIQKAILLK